MTAQRPELDFASVYGAHSAYVRHVLARRGVPAPDVDDALQEVFLVVHRQLAGFEHRARIETWLHSVAWRVAANYHRKKRPQLALPDGAAERGTDGDEQPAVPPSARLRALLKDIDDRQRDLLALHEIGGLSISELSDLTGNARATVRQALERARSAVGRRIWSALARTDDEAWVAKLGPRCEQEPVALPMTQPLVFERNVFSCVGDTAIALWRGAGTFESMEALLPILFALAERNPQGFRFMSVIEPSSSPPIREARDLTVWGLVKLGPAIRAAAWVAESSHLVSVVAPVMNTMFFLAGVPLNARFFDEVGLATSWLGEHGPHDAAHLTAHVDVLRQCLADRGIV